MGGTRGPPAARGTEPTGNRHGADEGPAPVPGGRKRRAPLTHPPKHNRTRSRKPPAHNSIKHPADEARLAVREGQAIMPRLHP